MPNNRKTISRDIDSLLIVYKCGFRVHPKSVGKMKNRIRELTDRNKSIGNGTLEGKQIHSGKHDVFVF